MNLQIDQYNFIQDGNRIFERAEKFIKGLEENSNKAIGWALTNRNDYVEYWETYDRKYLLKIGIGELNGLNKVVVL